MPNGAGNLDFRISTTLREFIKKMNSADQMLAKREKRLDKLRKQIAEQDAKLKQASGQLRGISVGAVRQIGTAGLTLAIQNTITSSGLETGGFFGRLAIGVGTGAAFGGGLPGAVTAGVTVLVSEIINVVGKLGEKIKKIEEQNAAFILKTENAIRETEEREKQLKKELEAFALKLDEEGAKKSDEMLYQIMRAQLLGRVA